MLEAHIKIFFVLKNVSVEQRSEQTQSYRRRGSDGSLQPLEATWQIFGKKITILTPFGSHFSQF